MAVGLTDSKIDRGQRSKESGHNKVDCNSLKMQYFELECIINGLPWQSFALSEAFQYEMFRRLSKIALKNPSFPDLEPGQRPGSLSNATRLFPVVISFVSIILYPHTNSQIMQTFSAA